MPSETTADHIPLVTGFGSSVLDVLMRTKTITLYGKNAVSHQIIQIGGVIPTALVALSRLGIKTELFTIIGNDMLGTKLLSILTDEHVGVSKILQTPSMQTPLATVVLEGETRTIFYTTADFSKQFEPNLADSMPKEASYLLIDGHNCRMSHMFVARAHAGGTRVIMDMGTFREGLDGLISESDTIVVPGAFWKALSPREPKDIAKDFLTKGPSTVIVTMEDKGIFVATKEELFYQPSYHVTALDTNGAGDVFFGTLTYGLLQKWPMTKTTQFAAAAAALSCTKIGKIEKIPRSEEEVFAFINTHTA